MNEFMKLIFSLSFSGTILFLIMYFLLLLCRGKVSRRWQYYSFLLVVLRFLIPFSSGDTLTARVFQAVEESEYVEGFFGIQDEILMSDQASALARVSYGEQDTDREKEADGNAGTKTDWYMDPGDSTEAAAGESAISSPYGIQEKTGVSFFWRSVFLIWAVTALALLLRKITVYQSYHHFLKRGNVEVSDIGILNLLAEKEEEMKIKRRIELYQNPFLTSPMMTGFFHPRIMIPSAKGTREELSCVFAHELVHYKYFDMYYKWLVQITICLHWFNPFVYLLGREINKNCELACDEKVICTMDVSARKQYGDTLLTFLETEEHYRNPLASLTLAEGAGELIERLGAIMDYKRKSVKILVLTVFLTLGIAVCSAALGVYAMQGTQGADSILYENGAYYILTEGTTAEDRPIGGFTGGFGIVLVKKDGYAAFGPFSRSRDFQEKLAAECQKGIKDGHLSEAEAEIIYKAAREIEDSGFSGMEGTSTLPVTRHAYMQRVFYREPYIIEMGWNMRDEWMESGTVKVTFDVLPDIPVYFNPGIKQYASDQDMADRIAKLVISIRETGEDVYSLSGEQFSLPIESLYLVNVIYLPRDEIEDYAKQAYQNDEITNFSYVKGELDQEAIADYCEMAYNEDRVDFFSMLTDAMPADLLQEFCERAYAEGNVSCFSIVLDSLPQEEIDKMAQTCYEKWDVMYFSMMVSYLSDEMRQNLMARAKRDNNMTFYYMLADTEQM